MFDWSERLLSNNPLVTQINEWAHLLEAEMQRTAVVTGAAGSIGLGATRKLIEGGRRVVMVDRDSEALAKAASTLPTDKTMPVAIDISDADAPLKIHQAARTWGPVSILVNNAAISPKHDGLAAGLLAIDEQEWNQVFLINVTAGLRLAKEFVPDMIAQNWGRIVNISSRAGRSHANAAGVAYMTSKAAILGMTRSFASEFARSGITANSVAPGIVESALTARVAPELLQKIYEKTPAGRAGTPDELGATIAFLASEDAGFINGACVDINGGALMC